MAKGKKTGGRDFQKGHSLGGRKKLPADLQAARNLAFEEMCRTVINTRNMTPAELKGLDLENMPLGQRAIINAYAKPDYRAMKDCEDRLWGKPKETVALMDETDFSEQFKKLEKIKEAIKNER